MTLLLLGSLKIASWTLSRPKQRRGASPLRGLIASAGYAVSSASAGLATCVPAPAEWTLQVRAYLAWRAQGNFGLTYSDIANEAATGKAVLLPFRDLARASRTKRCCKGFSQASSPCKRFAARSPSGARESRPQCHR